MILDIAILPPAVQFAIKNGEPIEFVENGQPIVSLYQHKINDGDYDIDEMNEAINAPSVVVPKEALKDFETFDKWIQSAFEWTSF